jgi:hypothetical protein
MDSVTKRSDLKAVADEAGRRLDTVLAVLAFDAARASSRRIGARHARDHDRL